MSEVKVEARGLTKRYRSLTAVDDLSLSVQAGEVFGLLGPNGAGKTTTIEMMEGLRRPDAGSCVVCGFDSSALSREVRQRIGISLQVAQMPESTKVSELLALYASFYPDAIQTGDLLAQFDLTDKARSLCQSLSGGQKQRLSIALALIGRPEVVFLDEPTSGLDPQARHGLWTVIQGLRDEGRAVIMTTHYMDEAERLCDRVAVIDHGRILAEGTPRALIREHGPEAAIELDIAADKVDLADLARLDAVTGVKSDDDSIILNTASTAASLMALAGYAREHSLHLGDLRTRQATLEDVFMTLTGRRLRD